MVAVDLPQVRAVRENQAKRAQALDEDETIPSDPYAAILALFLSMPSRRTFSAIVTGRAWEA
jgi:hypothetical protein